VVRLLQPAVRFGVLALVLTAVAGTAGSAFALSVSVDFEGAGGACGFAEGSPLRSLPAAPGLAFESAAGPLGGGAVLGDCAGFGIGARSGESFLAFNRAGRYSDDGRANDPETLHFEDGASRVSIWASGGHQRTSFQMDAFDLDGVLLGSTQIVSLPHTWAVLELVFPDIRSVLLTETGGDNAFVFDDLAYESLGVPEPTTALLLSIGVVLGSSMSMGVGLARRAVPLRSRSR
jgi:hypothetical protein